MLTEQVEARTGLARAAALQRRIQRGGEPKLWPIAVLVRLASVFYGLAARLKNRLFDWRLCRAHVVPAPVISVGNLTTGGTGKTPLVCLLAEAALEAGHRPAILTRGYRRPGVGIRESDEVRLYRRLLPDVPVFVDADRVRGARDALSAGADLLLMDDGFQHRRLSRTVDLVLADARDPFSDGRLLPYGLLREPVSSLSRATVLILTRAGRASPAERAAAANWAQRAAPGLTILLECHRPESLRDLDGNPGPSLEGLRDRPVLAFSGIGDPVTLLESLEALGADVRRTVDFGDHHEYVPAELDRLEQDAARAEADLLVTTEKDLMRIDRWAGAKALFALRIQAEFPGGGDREHLLRLVGLR